MDCTKPYINDQLSDVPRSGSQSRFSRDAETTLDALGLQFVVALAQVGILVGPKGRGSNMAALHAACVDGRVAAEIRVVIASTESSHALARAAELGLKTAVVPVGDDLLGALEGCEVVCLAGYLRLLPPEVLAAFPDRILNIHPALLPKFGGKGMYGHFVHEAVLASGDSESGCTVHLVSEVYDEGRILVQKRCPVLPDDTPDTLAARVLELEHQAFPEALNQLVGAGSERSDVLDSSGPEVSAVSASLRETHSLDAPVAKEPAKRRKAPGEVDLQHPFFTHVILPIERVIAWTFMTLFGPFRILNRRAIPRKGGVLIFANHRADVDPVVIYLGCPRPIYFMAKSELFDIPILGWLITCLRAFPVKRGEPDRSAIKQAVATAQAGQVVCVFPEGQLTETGKLQDLKPGAALMVRMAGVPVICCGVRNTDKIMPYGKYIPRPAFSLVETVWGEPRTFDRHAKQEEILGWVQEELLRLSGEK